MNDMVNWGRLPTELIRKIILMSDLTIDSRLEFKIAPKKLDEAKAWRLWYLLKSHDGIIYNLNTKSLHIMRIPGWHIVRRPVEMDQYDEHMTVFNSEGISHTVEITDGSGSVHVASSQDSFLTEMQILLKGSPDQLTSDEVYNHLVRGSTFAL